MAILYCSYMIAMDHMVVMQAGLEIEEKERDCLPEFDCLTGNSLVLCSLCSVHKVGAHVLTCSLFV